MDSDGAGSTTLTVNPQRPRLPLSSVAVQKTVVAPTGNNVPEGGTQTTVGVVSQTSVKTGVGKLTIAATHLERNVIDQRVVLDNQIEVALSAQRGRQVGE